MSTSNTSNQIYEIVTGYIDGEINSAEVALLEKSRRADHTHIEQLIDAELRVKSLVRDHCKQFEAPSHLRDRCMTLISNEIKRTESTIPTASDNTVQDPPSGIRFIGVIKYAAAAILLIATGFWSAQITSTTEQTLMVPYAVENEVQRLFQLASDARFDGIHHIHATDEAQQYLMAHFGMNVTVPELHNATFEGVELTELVPGHTTPMLKYKVAGRGDRILIFAFPIDRIENDMRLVRDNEAVKRCKSDTDTHIKDVDGKHVVSWKWGEVWYVGVSDHHGEVLASMLPTSN